MSNKIKYILKFAVVTSIAIVFTGCASNLTLSESIVFSDATGYDLQGFHIIEGGTISANYIPGANRYGTAIHSTDSINGLTYLTFIPNMGKGYGIASQQFSAAITAQLFMLGADITVNPATNVYLSGNITTNGSFSLACLGRTS